MAAFKPEEILADPEDLEIFRQAESGEDMACSQPKGVDITSQVQGMAIQSEVSRRFFNMLVADMLQTSFGGINCPNLHQKIMETQNDISLKDIMEGKKGLSIGEMVQLRQDTHQDWTNADEANKNKLFSDQNDNMILNLFNK